MKTMLIFEKFAVSIVPTPCAHHYIIQARHSGMDAGIQSQGCETSGLHFCSIKRLCSGQVTVHGTGFWHPCRNDGTFIARPDLYITTSAKRGSDTKLSIELLE
jgi:hypothetical protein